MFTAPRRPLSSQETRLCVAAVSRKVRSFRWFSHLGATPDGAIARWADSVEAMPVGANSFEAMPVGPIPLRRFLLRRCPLSRSL